MTTTARHPSAVDVELDAESIPPLQAGDRLTREEFERRWDLHPEIKKAELIDGLVFLEMTVGMDHAEAHGAAALWMGTYAATTSGVQMLDNATVRILDFIDVQPDVLLRRKSGGTSERSSDGRVSGPPELILEVAASSASYDLHLKRDLYLKAGVQEYVVWQVYEGCIDWWAREGDSYVPLETDERGVIESKVFPGLRMNVAAMLGGDMAAVIGELGARAG
jgi:Uma2 family endonuclease